MVSTLSATWFFLFMPGAAVRFAMNCELCARPPAFAYHLPTGDENESMNEGEEGCGAGEECSECRRQRRRLVSFSVLLVEADQCRSQATAAFLAKSGFVVSRAGSIAEAEVALSEPVAMLIVDIESPDGDGLAFCRRVRSYMPCGIILCLGRAERALRIAGLREGADACLIRPVDAEELEATLISVYRRLRFPPSPLLARPLPNPWLLDREQCLLTAPTGASVRLNALETQLLQTLFGHPGRKASREELVALLGVEAPGYSMPRLEALVSRLRAKAAEKCAMKLPLVSSYGRGYRFDAHVRIL